MLYSISKAYLRNIRAPSKHIYPICQSCRLCLAVIDLTERTRTDLLYLHGWKDWEASQAGDRWRSADERLGTPHSSSASLSLCIHWSIPLLFLSRLFRFVFFLTFKLNWQTSSAAVWFCFCLDRGTPARLVGGFKSTQVSCGCSSGLVLCVHI